MSHPDPCQKVPTGCVWIVLASMIIFFFVIALGKFDHRAKREQDRKELEAWKRTRKGAMATIRIYMKTRIKDPSSFQEVSAGLLIKSDQGYSMKYTFRAKNSFGAIVPQTMVYHFDSNMNITGAMEVQR